MAKVVNLVYRKSRLKLANGSIDFDADNFEAILLMSSTTASADLGAEFVDDIVTLDELDATGYARVALAGLTLTEDAVADRVEWIANLIDFGSPTADATRDVRGLLIVKVVTDDTDSPVVLFVDSVSSGAIFPFTVNGGSIQITPNAEGLIQL